MFTQISLNYFAIRSIAAELQFDCIGFNQMRKCIAIGRGPWSSGYVRRLMYQRQWVRILVPYTTKTPESKLAKLQTGPYSDTSLYGECSLVYLVKMFQNVVSFKIKQEETLVEMVPLHRRGRVKFGQRVLGFDLKNIILLQVGSTS